MQFLSNSVVQNTALQSILRSLFRLAVGREYQQFYESIDWQKECDRICNPDIVYPTYYTDSNIHGIEGGYLTSIAAITYDRVTAFASPPNEGWVRRQLLARVHGQPQRILDVGCGTGSTTVMLKQLCPMAQVIGLDLSPNMIILAEQKAKKLGTAIAWHHGLAENTGLEDESFDLVTASFLFHETPQAIAQSVLRESFRLIKPGGQVLILDGNQKVLRHVHWLIDLFREPYSKVYAAGCVDDWAIAANFEDVTTEPIGWIHQITTGKKPHLISSC